MFTFFLCGVSALAYNFSQKQFHKLKNATDFFFFEVPNFDCFTNFLQGDSNTWTFPLVDPPET